MIKDFKVEFTDENLEEILKQQEEQRFNEELDNLELKYCVENLEKYAKYLNKNLIFPLKLSLTIDNGFLGKEKILIEINEIIENDVRQGLKCKFKTPTGKIMKIGLHKLEIIDQNDKNQKLLTHFYNWYNKNH